MKEVLAFFGAFNPPTDAHINLAHLAMKATGIQNVVFVPSKAEYITGTQHKGYALTDDLRLEMLYQLEMKNQWMYVSSHDIDSKTQPRTYDSLCYLRDEERWEGPALLIGGDVLPKLETDWINVDKIAKEFGFVCLQRNGEDCRAYVHNDPFLSQFESSFFFVDTPAHYQTISSTFVRQRYDTALEAWRDVISIVPSEVSKVLQRGFSQIIPYDIGGYDEI